jgi:hypothetical protein
MSSAGPLINLEQTFKDLERLISSDSLAASPAQLRHMLQLLDDVTFIPALKALLERLRGQPQAFDIPNAVRGMARRAEELQGRREFTRTALTTAGAGGGTALVVGGTLACLNPAIGLIAPIAAAGGAWMGLEGYFAGRKLEQERVLYKQLAERVLAISKGMSINFSLSALTLAIIGVVLSVIFAITARVLTYRPHERKQDHIGAVIDKAIVHIHTAFLKDPSR